MIGKEIACGVVVAWWRVNCALASKRVAYEDERPVLRLSIEVSRRY